MVDETPDATTWETDQLYDAICAVDEPTYVGWMRHAHAALSTAKGDQEQAAHALSRTIRRNLSTLTAHVALRSLKKADTLAVARILVADAA